VKSFLCVHDYDVYKKAPTFDHYKKEEDGSIRHAEGVIMDVRGSFIFNGLVLGLERKKTKEYVGIKIMILQHGLYKSNSVLNGIYLSCDDRGDYEFGDIQVRRTDERYSEKTIGTYDIPKTHVLANSALATLINDTKTGLPWSSIHYEFSRDSRDKLIDEADRVSLAQVK
jgi:hypothetical protein